MTGEGRSGVGFLGAGQQAGRGSGGKLAGALIVHKNLSNTTSKQWRASHIKTLSVQAEKHIH